MTGYKERLHEAAASIRNDGTPSQVGLSEDECLAIAARIEALEAEGDEAWELAERLKLEAQGHASEARTANSTIYEIYQALTGGTGEPGNWNGAAPARAYVERCKRLKEALKEIEGMPTPFANATCRRMALRARLAIQENTNGG